jgi:hypothetical protein
MGSVIILILLIGLIFIVRLRNTYKLFKNPKVQKGIIYHLICFAILSTVHIPEPTRSLWEEEREIKKAVTIDYIENNLEDNEFRFGEVDDTNYVIYRDRHLDYDERQELNSQINEAIDEMYDSVDFPDFVYVISEKLSYVLIILWIVLSFALESMRKALFFALSIISLGLLFSNPGRNGLDDFNDNATPLKEEPSNTFVNPHYVNSYEKQDGTNVEGYWRDGDGDTTTNVSVKEGGGYLRTHPDGNTK